MAYHSTVDDIEDEISTWGYSTPLSDYGRPRQPDAAGRLPPTTTKVGGRGRGITNPQHMASIRLASEIGDLKVHSFPMGHMPTTEELLGAPAENEITPLLRQLGLSSQDDELDSARTRRMVSDNEEIRLDGNVPLILNGDLFKRGQVEKEDDEVVEEFDPNKPLHEQFSTIPELYIPEEEEEEVVPVGKGPKSTKSAKANTTDSSVDSGITVGSNSSGQSKKNSKEGKGGKKKKWRKMTPQEMIPKEPERGRYEEVYTVGVHDTTNTGVYAPRQMYGVQGLRGWSNEL